MSLCMSLLRLLLMYPYPVWVEVSQQKLKRIQSFQNRRISTNVPWFTGNTQLLRETGLLTTKSLIRSQAHRFFGIPGAEYYSLGKDSLNHVESKAAFHKICY